jgi:hypothetical protein
MDWKKLLAYISGSVDEDLLLRNEYLVTENRILRAQIKGRQRLTDGERKTLAEIGKKLGKKVLAEVASIVKPETILAWHRRLVAKKFDGSKKQNVPRATEDRRGGRGPHHPPREGESILGLRSNRWRARQSQLQGERPVRRQCPQTPRHPSGP